MSRFKKFIFLGAFLFPFIDCKEVTFVVDTTFSMDDEILAIKSNVRPFLESLRNSAGTKVDSFTVVPFNDPRVQTTSTTPYPEEFASVLSGLKAGGGSACEENSLLAIHRALELSQDSSDIFVFTDAYARPYDNLDGLINLCSSKKSRVTVFLTGKCLSNTTDGDGFSGIYPACSGMVYSVRATHLTQVFGFITELVTGDWAAVTDRGTFYGRKQFKFNSVATSNGLLIAMSGEYPSLETIVDSDNSTVETKKIVETKNTLVTLAASLKPGNYIITTNSQGPVRTVFYTMQKFPFQLGFSMRVPRSLRETSSRPMPGRPSYMMLTAPSALNVEVTSVKLTIIADGSSKEAKAERHGDRSWVANFFFSPDAEFQITVIGQHQDSNEYFEETSKALKVQELGDHSSWTSIIPSVEILDSEVSLDYGSGARLACLVRSFPEPRVTWEGEPNLKPEELLLLEIPSTYLSYVDIRPESDTTYTCKAVNVRGEARHQLKVAVIRPAFLRVTPPLATTIAYQTQGSLTCVVQSYPKAMIKWYHNATEVVSSSNVWLDGDTLRIKSMSLDDVGIYMCEVTNGVETQTHKAQVDISEIEPPVIENALADSEIITKLGDRSTIMCRVSEGKPAPTLTWTYKKDDYADFEPVPRGVTASDPYLDIPSISEGHRGTYRCEAANEFGRDSWEVVVRVQSPPSITDADATRLAVRAGAPVELACAARGDPTPAVRWRRERRGQEQPLSDRVSIDEEHTLSFFAEWSDSGEYHCVAENAVGKAEKVVTVEVHVAPYIQPAEVRNLQARTGEDVTLPCEVEVASPEPTISWKFFARSSWSRQPVTLESRYRVGMSVPYQLNSVNAEHSGTYMCIASNNIGTDDIKYSLKVN